MAAPRLILPDDDKSYDIIIGDSFKNEDSFATFKYEFIPASVNQIGSGEMLFKGKNKQIVELKLPSTQKDVDNVTFKGKHVLEKNDECILLFDGVKKVFRLEKLNESIKNLRYVRNTSKKRQKLENDDGSSFFIPPEVRRSSRRSSKIVSYREQSDSDEIETNNNNNNEEEEEEDNDDDDEQRIDHTITSVSSLTSKRAINRLDVDPESDSD